MLVNTGHCKLLHALAMNAKAPVYSYLFSHGSTYFTNYFKETREMFENSEGTAAPKRPKRSLHMTLDAPWTEQYYLFYPVEEDFGTMRKAVGANSNDNRESSLNEDDRKIMDALAKIWVSFAKYAQPKQAITELPEYGRWVRMEAGHRSLNYYHISNLSLQKGMRSDYRKAVREINKCKNLNISIFILIELIFFKFRNASFGWEPFPKSENYQRSSKSWNLFPFFSGVPLL